MPFYADHDFITVYVAYLAILSAYFYTPMKNNTTKLAHMYHILLHIYHDVLYIYHILR